MVDEVLVILKAKYISQQEKKGKMHKGGLCNAIYAKIKKAIDEHRNIGASKRRFRQPLHIKRALIT